MPRSRALLPARAGALLACALTAALGDPAPASAAKPGCLAATHAVFERSFATERAAIERCLARGQGAATCPTSDARMRAARARALAAGRRACPGGRPALGSAGLERAAEEAVEAARALAAGLLGPAPEPAPTAAGARCRRRAVAAAYRCADRFAREYHRCAVRAVQAGASDASALVACKGADPQGRIARACARAVEAVVDRCAGQDLAALLPGCAGDAAACLRGHARRSASLALNGAGGLCEGVDAGTAPESTLLQCYEPPPLESVRMRDVPVPDGVRVVTIEGWDARDGLTVTMTAPGVAGTQLARLGADGSGFRCLTCGSPIAGNRRPVQVLQDGRRALVSGPNGPAPAWSLLECAPDLDDCASAALVPIEMPANPDASTPILQYRVPWVTPDDAWLIWSEVRLRGPGGNLTAMGRLVREADRYRIVDARVIAPALPSGDPGADPRHWAQLTQPFEAKGPALRGGRDWVEAGTPDAGHYDDLVIDLATGDVRRLTHHPDHDEGIRFSPDEQWAVLSSGRTDERVEFLGLVPRPPYLEWLAFSVHFVAIAGAPGDGPSPGGDPAERDCYVDPWLVDRWFERGDYLGQRMSRPSDGWESVGQNAGGMRWAPDGTAIALLEQRWRRLVPPGEPQPTRLRIAELPARRPVEPVPLAATPEPRWATPYADWVVPDTSGVRVVPGLASGTATIRNDMASVLQGELEVVYRGYSDDGAHVLDGYERMRVPVALPVGAVYEVDLILRGARRGTMRGAVDYDFANDRNVGEVVSELDGRVLGGPRTCSQAGLIPDR